MKKGRIKTQCNADRGFFPLVVFLFCLAAGFCIAEPSKSLPFRNHLENIGRSVDCHFTVESVGSLGMQNNTILDSMVLADTSQIRNISDVLFFLTNQVTIVWRTGAATNQIPIMVKQHNAAKTIISIRDHRLDIVPHYALRDPLTLEYHGNPSGFVEYIQRADPSIRRPVVFPVGNGPVRFDGYTAISVNATNQPVRQILTDCIPLKGYNRIIWSSYTDGNPATPVVTVEYHGRSPRAEQDK